MYKVNNPLSAVLCLVAVLGFGAMARAADPGTLIIYNCNAEDWTMPVIKEFEKETGIKVENIAGTSGQLMARIRSEARNPQADIMWGGTHDSHLSLIKFLQPYESKEKGGINPDFTRADNAFYQITMDPFLLAYNTDLVKDEEAPRVWADMLDPKWKGKISLCDPSKSSSVYSSLVTMMKIMNTDFSVMEKLIDNLDGRTVSSSSAMIQQLSDGEYSVTLIYEEPANKYVKNGAPIKIVYPEDGTMVITGCIAIVKDGPNPENAKKFIDFAMSKKAHQMFDSHSRRSTRIDLDPPKEMTPLSEIKYIPFDAQFALDYKNEFMSKWQEYVEQ